MIALMLALAAMAQAQPAETQSSPAGQQPAQARLSACELENGRWVCRYEMPTYEIVPVAPEGAIMPPAAPPTVAAPAPADPGALTEAEARLVLRCADAGWMSLCLPHERREARTLKVKADAHEALRGRVTTLLSQGRCADGVRVALEGGSLALARQARSFCADAAEPESARAADTD